jgi:alginate O-acetyltransferase complex protein AlgI
MVFSSPIFLFLFLPVTVSLALVLRGPRWRNLWLLAVSLLFYGWAEPAFVLLILASTLCNYALGLRIGAAAQPSRRQAWTTLAVAVNVGVLVLFKYGNFLVANLNGLLAALHVGPLRMRPIALPIGISFFTFHALSYIIDVYRRKGVASRRPSELALYIFFFPQLIAGPILRWSAMAPQIAQRAVTPNRFFAGVRRFILGLAKKTLVANTVAAAADRLFALSPEALSPAMAWVGVVCYSLQIYFDFSGYSDMAIGLGKMFGFKFMENFSDPYVAQSIREFWRRWHISLSSWFRDYLYIPLGGNRGPALRTAANLLVVFFLCGLWHGASWTFVVWGLYHGLFLALERTRLGSWLAACPTPVRHAYTLLAVMLGWVIFRADTLPQALTYLRTLFGLAGAAGGPGPSDVLLTMAGALGLVADVLIDNIQHNCPLVPRVLTGPVVFAMLAGVLFSAPAGAWFRRELRRALPQRLQPALQCAALVAQPVLLMLLLVASAAGLAAGTYNPFIYFRF